MIQMLQHELPKMFFQGITATLVRLVLKMFSFAIIERLALNFLFYTLQILNYSNLLLTIF